MSNGGMVPIRISSEVHTALKVLAAVTGVTMREFAEQTLRRGIREEASQDPELAQAIDLVLGQALWNRDSTGQALWNRDSTGQADPEQPTS